MKKNTESIFKKIVMFIVVMAVSFGPFGTVSSVFAAPANNLIANPSFEVANTGVSVSISQNVTVTVVTTTPPPALTSLVVVPSTTVVVANGTVQLTATPLDQNGVPIVATTTFASSAPTIATVNSSGLLTGVAAGTATITTTSGTLTATTAVTVVTTPTMTRNLTSVVPVPLTPIIATNGTVALTTASLDQNNSLLTSGVTTTYTSDTPAVATVDPAKGIVTGVGVGSATIKVTSSYAPGGDMPQGWSEGGWGTNTRTFSYLNTGQTGSRSAQVQITSYTDGDAKWVFPPVAIPADPTHTIQYAYSDYYQATVPTQVVAVFTMADKSTVNQIIGLPDPASTWTPFATQFSIPLGAQSVTIYHLIQQVGTLTIDDVDLHSYTPVPFNRALISLTFDNGYQSTYNQALPILAKYGFKSTQFIITDLINDSNNTNPGYMTGPEINTMYNSGLGQEIASHTVTHNDLTLPNTDLTNELSGSQTTLSTLIGAPVTDLAYPYGLYNSGVFTATQKYYKAARGVEDALNSKDNFDAYDIRVQNVFDTTTTAQVQDWVNQALATKTWLVLVYHSVNSITTGQIDSGIYNITPTQLDAQLLTIQTTTLKDSAGKPIGNPITVVPMNQAFAEVTCLTPNTWNIQTQTCDAPGVVTLQSIAITHPANKLSYTVGDSLDITGLVVTGTYSNATTKVETITASNVTGFNSTSPATGQMLTITDNGKTATYTVNINAATTTATLSNIAITTPATKLTYTVGDTLNISGLVVTGTYSDNSKKVETITTSNITDFNSSAPATGQVLTINDNGKTATYTININAATVNNPPSEGGDNNGGTGGGSPSRSSGGGRRVITTLTSYVLPAHVTPVVTGQVLGVSSFHFASLLKVGSKGNEVSELQMFLVGKGFDPGIADGTFGPKTRDTVIKFQIANGLNGDGIIGPITEALLNK